MGFHHEDPQVREALARLEDERREEVSEVLGV